MARTRNYAAEYVRRQERARAEGYPSYWAKRTHAPGVRPAPDLAALPPRQRASRSLALEAVARMRTQGLSLTDAAAHVGTTSATVRRYAGDALERRGGRVVARPADRIYRRMRVLSADGPIEVDVRGSRAASVVGRHWAAVGLYLTTGDASALLRLAGARVGGVELLTDPQRVKELARQGQALSYESIYAQAAS